MKLMTELLRYHITLTTLLLTMCRFFLFRNYPYFEVATAVVLLFGTGGTSLQASIMCLFFHDLI